MPPASTRALHILRETYGYPAFRGQQGEVIDHVISGGSAFVLMPTDATEGATIASAVTVAILDAFGNVTPSTASVTLSIGTNPGGGTLTGGGATAGLADRRAPPARAHPA